MTSDQLAAVLAARVMGWTVAPDRFLMGKRSWIPRWRFQPWKCLENALDLLDAAKPDRCSMVRDRGFDWSVTIAIGDSLGSAQDPSPARAITLAVAQAVGVDVSTCE